MLVGGTGETPQERKRRRGSAAACGKRSLARKSTAVLKVIHTNSFIQFVLSILLKPFCCVLS
ncbi:hypothetical protein C1N83_05125 [Priestia aryabhattai]|uniref:hypothetical protein n=1 Tax=Priestia TaxID=2800373 RepID=UPI0009BC3E5A|nr:MULTISPECIES: hypothetical protein [Priestia]MBY0004377.1 hypothetical protein [Priestia aryabhattai]MBY0046338.1 hypothetical protein [Priestia aryabhattai]MDE8672461.1 hypothetical protein [Priestia aryabhattai]WDC87270.1 hypothetical protein PSR56_19950 [Priestia megaterium]